MSIFAIGDLHLPGHAQKAPWTFSAVIGIAILKPSAITGGAWSGQRTWCSSPATSAGPCSWTRPSMTCAPSRPCRDGNFCCAATMIIGGVRSASCALRCRRGMFALQNDALALEGHIFCGTRGWMFPTVQQPLGAQDEKVFRRELMRLRMSLDQAAGLSGQDITVLMHYPPLVCRWCGHALYGHSGGILP